MVNNLPKEMTYTKANYLELLMEHVDGLTPSDVSDIYFDDVSLHAANNALRRLKKGGLAVRRLDRQLDGSEFRYWITDRGIRRYDYLRSKEK